VVELRIRKSRGESFNEFFINGSPVEMGEGPAELVTMKCPIHGEQEALYGYNQGGHDGVTLCLKCCREILSFLSGNK
jgi:hypothetical protein